MNLYFYYNKKNEVVPISKLIYIASDKGYINLHTTTTAFKGLSLKLKSFLAKVDHPTIIQIHRSYVVNCGYIVAFTDEQITLDIPGKSPVNLPIGPTFKQNFQDKFVHSLIYLKTD